MTVTTVCPYDAALVTLETHPHLAGTPTFHRDLFAGQCGHELMASQHLIDGGWDELERLLPVFAQHMRLALRDARDAAR
jgi:hypothetical protein